jgi:hypothetical protein
MFRVYVIFWLNIFSIGAYGDLEPGKEISIFALLDLVHMSLNRQRRLVQL